MKTLERRIEETLRHEAEGLPSEETAHSLAPMRQDRRRRLRPGLAAPAAVVLVFILAAPVIWLTAGRGPESPPSSISSTDQSGVSTATTSPATNSTDSPAETPTEPTVPTFVVTDLGTQGPDPTTVGDAFGARVGETLESTGKNYNPLPEAMADAATIEDRVVVVGGNETRNPGIWYSDGGDWTPADINFPTGVNIGENPGDFRLADGLLHLETLPSGQLLAWQPIQRLTSSSDAEASRPEPVTAGTILISSTDGASWTVSIVDYNFTQVASWGEGVVATSWTQNEDGQATSAALWSQNLTSWTQVADLGQGEAYHLETDDNRLTVSLVSWETTVNEDGNITYGPDMTTRQVSLTPD